MCLCVGCLFFNAGFSVLYAIVAGGGIVEKMVNLEFQSPISKALLVPFFIFWAVGEASRFYFGYFGNLRELVPQISAFLMLTVFPALFAMVFLTFGQEHRFPFDTVAGSLMIIALVVEIIVGCRAVQTLIARQTAQFYRLVNTTDDADDAGTPAK